MHVASAPVTLSRASSIAGTLLGMAVGDALGLPREGLARARAERMFGTPPLRHRFLFSRGMVSDDTEHAVMTASALLVSRGSDDVFASELAARLRWWLVRCPAGIGLATLRATVKLWLGYGPHGSGVFSAGNGPAMRAPMIGVYYGHDREKLKATVRISTRLTHTDPKAEEGALAIALAASIAAQDPATENAEILKLITESISGTELRQALERVDVTLSAGLSVREFADQMGWQRGISGYINHTVPLCLFAWLRHRDSFRRAVESAICCGGDTDTAGAIVGGLSGAALGNGAIPAEWLEQLWEWPQSLDWLEKLADRVATPDARPPRTFWPAYVIRQPLFAATVLVHGFRRLFPPY